MRGLCLVGSFSSKGSIVLWSHFPDSLQNSNFNPIQGTSFARLALPRSSTNRKPLVFTVDNNLFISYPVFLKEGWLKQEDPLYEISPSESVVDELVGFAVVLVASKSNFSLPANEQRLRHSIQQIGESLLLQENLSKFISEEISAGLESGQLVTLLHKITESLVATGSVHLELPHNIPLSVSIRNPQSTSSQQYVHEAPIRPYHSLLLLQSTEKTLELLPLDASSQLVDAIKRVGFGPTRSIHELQAETGFPASQLLRISGHLVTHGLAAMVDTLSEENRLLVGSESVPSLLDSMEFDRLFEDGLNGEANEISETGDPLSERKELLTSNLEKEELASLPAPAGSTLIQFLASFSLIAQQDLPLRDLLHDRSPSERQLFLSQIAWLLKKRFLLQRKQFIFLLWPWVAEIVESRQSHDSYDMLPEAATTSGNGSKLVSDRLGDQGGMKPSTSELSSVGPNMEEVDGWLVDELEYISEILEGKDEEMQLKFIRVLTHLRETHIGLALDPENPGFMLACRIEEVMYRLKLSRVAIMGVIDAFPEIFLLSKCV